MAFDLNTAQPVGKQGFDVSTAQPVAPQPVAPPPAAPAQKKPIGQMVNEKLAEKTGQTFGQDLVVNLLDNPMGEWFISKVAPNEEEAQKAIQYIKERSGKFRTGTAEATGAVASGIVAEPAAGLAGLATTPMGAEKAVENIEGTREALTYEPKTEEGQRYLQGVAETMQPVAEKIKATEEAIGEVGYEAGGPILGAFGQALPTAVLSALGLKGMPASKPTKLKLKIAQDLKASSAQPELGRMVKSIADDTASGKLNPKQLPAVIKAMEDDIVSKSGEGTYKRLSKLADDAKAGNPEAVNQLSQAADDIGSVQADKTLATYIAQGTKKATTDPVAKEAIKQGFDPGVVTAAKGASKADRAKMLEMVDVMEKGKKNRLATLKNVEGMKTRPSDVAGDSLLERVKYVRNMNREAAGQLDTVAKSLKGQPADFKQPIQNFLDNLDEMGIQIDRNLQPVFKGSDIEGLAGPQAAIRNIVKRLQTGKTPDAYDLHRMKKYIDENVTYGKGGEGLKGKTENILKQLRRDLDSTLDNQFPEYNKVNTQYSDTRTALDAIQDVAGKKMDLGGGNTDKAVGTLLRRMMSNAQSRVNLVDAINNVESAAKKYGATFDDDIATQMLFVDELNNVFGPVARTSLAGEVEKAVKAGAGVATGRKGVLEAGVDILGKGVEKARGINEENAFKSIREILKRE